jgi:hypothetical protein
MTLPQPVVEQILALAAEGRSRGQIARELGNGVTRSAVIGVLWRRQRDPTLTSKPSSEPTKPRHRPPRPTAEVVCLGVPLLEVGPNACRWPISGKGLATLFCGADRGTSRHPSYCPHHHGKSLKIYEEQTSDSERSFIGPQEPRRRSSTNVRFYEPNRKTTSPRHLDEHADDQETIGA